MCDVEQQQKQVYDQNQEEICWKFKYNSNLITILMKTVCAAAFESDSVYVASKKLQISVVFQVIPAHIICCRVRVCVMHCADPHENARTIVSGTKIAQVHQK